MSWSTTDTILVIGFVLLLWLINWIGHQLIIQIALQGGRTREHIDNNAHFILLAIGRCEPRGEDDE
jgi:hypothetical protein